MPTKRRSSVDLDSLYNEEAASTKEAKAIARARKRREKKIQAETEEVALRVKIRKWERDGIVPPLASVTARLGPPPPDIVKRREASRKIQEERRGKQLALIGELDERGSASTEPSTSMQVGERSEANNLLSQTSPSRRRDRAKYHIIVRGPPGQGLRLGWDDDNDEDDGRSGGEGKSQPSLRQKRSESRAESNSLSHRDVFDERVESDDDALNGQHGHVSEDLAGARASSEEVTSLANNVGDQSAINPVAESGNDMALTPESMLAEFAEVLGPNASLVVDRQTRTNLESARTEMDDSLTAPLRESAGESCYRREARFDSIQLWAGNRGWDIRGRIKDVIEKQTCR